jgi:5-(carboxyamino)imidazole ribonucleotide synthase
MFSTQTKIGILGGGQLGKMLCLAAAKLDIKTYILDRSKDFPAGPHCFGFEEGNFNDYADVLRFGMDKDVITIEIEHVNTDALRELERLGKKVYPSPAALDIIKDKGLQKQFFVENGIPTTHFEVFQDENALRAAVQKGRWKIPFVQKSRTAGYDGRGVSLIRNQVDLALKLLPGLCIAEAMAPINKEIAVIAARNEAGEIRVFPAVEMDFHPEANLVEFLICPARISPLAAAKAEALAEQVANAFGTCGLLAVEMFLDSDGNILVNEVAPRPHNSGHHSIETTITSQYEQHLRAICGLPLGDTAQILPAVMLNLLGEEGHKGPVRYEGIEACLAMPGVYVHLYGKAQTSPFRKMGHVTVSAADIEEALGKAKFVKENLKVVT